MIGAWRILGVRIDTRDIEYTEEASKSESFLSAVHQKKAEKIESGNSANFSSFFLLVSHEIRGLSAVCLVEMQISSRPIKQKRGAVKKQTATARAAVRQ